jgi:Mlc titration factor MtfA (ptsG expression regulator)
MFRALRRRYWLRRRRVPLDLWHRALAEVPIAWGFTPDEEAALHDLVVIFLQEKAIHGAGHFEPTWTMRLAIAIQACVPILHLGLGYYDGWVEMLVYPGRFRVPREHHDEAGVVHREVAVLCGEAWHQGPVILSWQDVERDLRNPGLGRNVVVHELAHKMDMLDGSVNGLPPLHRNMALAAWTEALASAYENLCAGVEGEDTAIDPYAATDPGEFFAVVTETFFDAPDLLAQSYPAVYRQLSQFFRQDPMSRMAAARAWVTE